MKAQAVTESKSVALISANPPSRSFLSSFLRWEWMLVGLILLDVFINTAALPIFPGCKQSGAHFFRLYGNWVDDAADGVHYHHWQY